MSNEQKPDFSKVQGTVRGTTGEVPETRPTSQGAGHRARRRRWRRKARSYTVEKGDTLSHIAKAHYGRASKWRRSSTPTATSSTTPTASSPARSSRSRRSTSTATAKPTNDALNHRHPSPFTGAPPHEPHRVLLPLAAALLAALARWPAARRRKPSKPPTACRRPPPRCSAAAGGPMHDARRRAATDGRLARSRQCRRRRHEDHHADEHLRARRTRSSPPSPRAPTTPTATVPAKVGAKWTHVDSNQTVNEEARDVQLKGEQTWDFEITNPEPWPTGNYRVEVMLDGTVGAVARLRSEVSGRSRTHRRARPAGRALALVQ